MLNLARLLPHQHNIYSVVHADCQYKAERQHIEEIQINVQQFHRSDHCSNPERECDDLDHPQTKIPVQKRQQRDVENRHQRADDQELMMRPRQQIGERITPA